MSSERHLLQNYYLFKGWSSSDLEKIAQSTVAKTYVAGDDIFCQGDEAANLFIVKYGSVRAHRHGSQEEDVDVATLGTGSHFGELPFLDGEPRSSTVSAVERTEIISIAYQPLRAFLETHPEAAVTFYRSLATFLCGRLRVTSTDLSFARVRNLKHF